MASPPSLQQLQQAQISPSGHTDNRMRAPGTGYAGGPTATFAKGPTANLAAGKVSAPTAPTPTSKYGVGPINITT
jgi:hypothetical protein